MVLSFRLDAVKINEEEVEGGAAEDEKVEDGVEPFCVVADAVKNRADCVANSATNQEPDSGERTNGSEGF